MKAFRRNLSSRRTSPTPFPIVAAGVPKVMNRIFIRPTLFNSL